jgi:hypothetical protein
MRFNDATRKPGPWAWSPRRDRRSRRFLPERQANFRLENRALLTGVPIVTSTGPISGKDGDLLSDNLANGANSDGTSAATDTFLIDWGDGTTSTGTVTQSSDPNTPYAFSVQSGHEYFEESAEQPGGVYTITVTVTNHNGGTATGSSTSAATITEGGIFTGGTGTVTINVGQPDPFAVATFHDDPSGQPNPQPANTPFNPDVPSDFTASVDWGDGHTTGGTIVGGNTAGHTPGAFSIFGDQSHTYSTTGTFTVTTTISQVGTSEGASTVVGTATSTVIVGTPSPPPQTPPRAAGVGTILAKSGTQLNSDLANFDDLDDAGVKTAANYTATVDWGDGSALDNTAVIVGSNGYFSVEGSHTYASPGTHTITVTVHETGVGDANPVTDTVIVS